MSGEDIVDEIPEKQEKERKGKRSLGWIEEFRSDLITYMSLYLFLEKVNDSYDVKIERRRTQESI